MVHAWVPMDDEHTMYYLMAKKSEPLVAGARHLEFLPNTTDWYGRFGLAANAGNDYLIDREMQRDEDFTGITGIRTQDKAVTESMGPVRDRTTEHLGPADVMVIRVRRRLLAVARELAERGITPPGASNPDVYRVRSGGVFLPEGVDWLAATEELRKAFTDHPELDLTMAGRGA